MEALHKILVLGAGGFIGSNLRYWLSLAFSTLLGSAFPYGTLFVNALGSFLLGFLFILSRDSSLLSISPRMQMFLGTGLLGALTTFSTFSVETMTYFREGNLAFAFLNVFFNLMLALTMAYLGFFLASKL